MKRYIKNPKATQDDLKKKGVYTLYIDNVLKSTTAVLTNTTGGAVQYEIDEVAATWRRRLYNPNTEPPAWEKWSDPVPITYTENKE